MRPSVLLMAVGVAAVAACAPQPPIDRNPPPAPPPPPPGTTIQVIPASGVTYARTVTTTLGVLQLLDCGPAAAASGSVTVGSTTASHHAANGAGDDLDLPPGSAASGTVASVARQAGTTNRVVQANASGPVRNVRLTISTAGCTPYMGRTTVVRHISGDIWEDVGGTPGPARITTPPLDHLSIFALAGG